MTQKKKKEEVKTAAVYHLFTLEKRRKREILALITVACLVHGRLMRKVKFALLGGFVNLNRPKRNVKITVVGHQ